ncbi:MAG: hypothetical protein M0Q13_00565 [Methanothrix sp.]|jgi:hypothetical protein|nr:hypothetical protein [Methanothrix sp.]
MSAADNDETEAQLEENGAAYDNPTTLEENSIKFNFEQNVSGTGFFTAYKYAQMPNALGTEGQQFNGVEAKNKAHGSGKINTDSTIYAESSYSNKTWINGAYDEDGEEIEDEEGSTSIIQMKEDSKMTYSPLAMGIGSRYYNHNPVVFNSLLSEDDWIKNRDDFNSMHHRIDRAHGLNKVLEAQSNAGDDTVNTAMDVEEDLIDGRAHFGVLQLEGIPADEEPEEGSEEVQVLGLAMKAWKKPLIDIDEDYVGSYHIKKNMDISTYTDEDEEEDLWLPCCFGGFGDMNYADAAVFKSARGVFDCTCFKAPIRAQFAG